MAPVQVRQPTQQFACSLELDINTAPEQSDRLPCERLADLLEELTALGREIAEKRDEK